MQNLIKILNQAQIKKICDSHNIKISKKAMEELSVQTWEILREAISDTRSMGKKVIKRRFIERVCLK